MGYRVISNTSVRNMTTEEIEKLWDNHQLTEKQKDIFIERLIERCAIQSDKLGAIWEIAGD